MVLMDFRAKKAMQAPQVLKVPGEKMDLEVPKVFLEKSESRAPLVLPGQREKKVILGSEVPSGHKVLKVLKGREVFLAPWVPKVPKVTLDLLAPKVMLAPRVPRDSLD
jgi:hypothetical protein